MRRTLPALFVTLIAAPVFAQGVKTVDQAWTKAIKAGDVAALTALYAPDAVMYPPDEAKAKGREAIRASWEKFLGSSSVQDVALTYDRFGVAGNVSYASGNFRLTLAPKAGGDPQIFEGRFTSIAERKAGKWLYVSDHASVPMPPPSAPE